jgi:chromosome segregation protein
LAPYASFRKCDFQTHSPRDPNWQGPRPPGLGDSLNGNVASADDVYAARMAWAKDFVDACVKKELRAVAITDHHDMVMVKYVLDEIAQRISNGADPDLWIFPGMELTLQDGMQCLVLFDSELPQALWQQAQAVLGIDISADFMSATTGPVQQLNFPYDEIASRLDPVEKLHGRYIVLPNVSQGGQYTVVSQAKYKRFREMPYIGGYLDAGQTLLTCSSTHRKRLSGEDPVWGDRFIYPLPTSDSRNATFGTLGSNNCWIKLSAPSAESVRQAFLAWQSRIRIERPTLPSVVIKSISARGANPMANVSLTFSPELNSIIGGRGSGKSTLLEYVAFGLGRSSYDLKTDSYSGEQRLTSLVADTIVAANAEIKLVINQDGADFVILRGANTGYQPEITYPNGKKETLNAKEIRALFPAYIYRQGELSEMGAAKDGVKLTDLLGLVEASFKQEADQTEKKINSAKTKLSEAYRQLIHLWEIQASKSGAENRINALRARITALQSTLPKLNEADEAVVAKHTQLLEASEEVTRVVDDTESTLSIIDELDTLSQAAKPFKLLTDDPQLIAVKESFEGIRTQAQETVKKLKADLISKQKSLLKSQEEWNSFVAQHQRKRDAILDKIGAQKLVAKQVAELQTVLATETTKLQQLDRNITAIGDPSASIRVARDELKTLIESHVESAKRWSARIEELSDKIVEVDLRESGNLSEINDALDLLAQKTRSQEAIRHRRFADLAAREGAWAALNKIASEVSNLLKWKIEGGTDLKSRPSIEATSTILGDGENISKALIEQVEPKRLFALVEAAPRISVGFKYNSVSGPIAFEKASEGQRATVLLMMLLKQGGGPLLIDQPEGDLDNSVITKIVASLHNIKHLRQIIFASHNANLVVNGASELVAIMNNDDQGHRIVEFNGAIDDHNICNSITSNMEGGKEAFRDRQRKYGF